MRAAFGVRSLVVFGATLSTVAFLSGQAAQPTATWADVGSGGAVPAGAAAVALSDGRTLILGGLDATGAPSNAALFYDPASRSTSPAGALLAGRTGHTATALSDGRVVVSGGVIGGLVSGDVEVFDVASGTSSLAAILPEPRSGHVAARLAGDAVLVAGGSGVDGAALQSAAVVDASTGMVTALTGQLSVARVDASATTLIDGRVLVAGGSDGIADLATAEIYDPFAQTFSVLATSMSVPRRGHAAVLLPHNASVLVAGGTSNGVVQSGADLFLPAEFPDPFSYGVGRFAATGAMTAPRVGGITTSTAVEGFAIADGGGHTGAEVYRFATIKSDKDDYAPGELALLTGTGWQPGETVRLTFQEDPPVHDDYVVDVVADGAGNVRWDQWAPEYHDLGVRFYLMASGSVAKAQTTFTDALRVNVQRLMPTGASQDMASGSTLPVTFRLSNTNTPPNASTSIIVDYALTVSGVTATGAPLSGSVTLASAGALVDLSWNIVAPVGPATGTATLAATIRGCAGGPPAVCAANMGYTLHVEAPADSTPPVITPSVTGTLGNAGWYTSDVGLTWTVTDAQSAISSSTGCVPSNVVADTPGMTFTCEATSAGGTNTVSVTIKRDASAPNAPTASATPAANANGWNNSDVTVAFASAGDIGPSGVLSCTASTTLAAETAGTVVSGTCTDNAGNTSAAAEVTVKIDKTAPAAPGAVVSPPANANGWHNTDVTVSFTAGVETGSGIASCTAPTTLTADTAGTVVSGTCTDNAGNVSAATDVTVKIDKVAPTIALNPGADGCDAPGLLGWCRGTQTAGFTSSDTLSGLASGYSSPFTKTTTTNGAAVVIPSGQVCDLAGNCGASIDAGPFEIDSMSPSLSRNVGSDLCSVEGAAGWCRGTQTAGFAATDATSGLADGVTSPFTQSTAVNGAAVTIPSGQVCDVAGNCAASIDAGPFKIDSVVPSITLTSRLPVANAFGWNNTAVTVTWACSDGTSGPVAAAVSTAVASQGQNQSATGTCLDVAGNSASDSHGNISIDTTAPVVAVTGVSQDAVYVLGAVPAAGCSTSDALSGVNTSATLAVTGGVAPGVGTFTAACSDASDNAGNTAAASVTYKAQFAPVGTSCLGSPAHEVLQPVNSDGTSVFKQKSTVPVKFRVCDANGVSIGANVVAAFALVQIVSGAASTDVNEEVQSTTPDTTFRFDLSAQQWIFNTNTKTLQASRTYRYWITLTDGSRIEYQFGLK
jgi:hypothetical protein